MKKTILFRADGNATTGLGHLYRLMAIVELVKTEVSFVFILKETSNAAVIPNQYKKLLIPKEVTDEAQWFAHNFDSKNTIIIADGYHFNEQYRVEIKEKGFKMVYIDDLCKGKVVSEAIINHSPQIKEKDYNGQAIFGLGASYAILRPYFLKKAREYKTVKKKINSAFVCYGGADPEDFTYKTVAALLKIPAIKNINIVLGAAYKHQTIFKHQDAKIKIYKNIDEKKMIALIANSDLSFVAASSILYETIAVKSIIFSGYYVSNQEAFYKAILAKNTFIPLGDLNTFNFENIQEKIQQIGTEKIAKLYQNQSKLIDGLSGNRIKNIILQVLDA